MSAQLRRLPAVHALAGHPGLKDLHEAEGPALLTEAARQVLEAARAAILADGEAVLDDHADAHDMGSLVRAVRRRMGQLLDPRPSRLINATGVILHTNLGRAPVSATAARAMAEAAAGYSDLEYELAEGRRGSRHDLLAPLLAQICGAEASLTVNNNAGATLLILSALAAGKGVLVSRGELVEIGGGYRIPDVMAAGGAKLVEVGTTNRTRISDYARALDAESALLMRVHTSNYRIVGFTEAPELAELVALGKAHDLPVVDDLGSGSFLDTRAYGLAPEPMVPASIAAGADLVCFSGDKLLGGPQAGIIVGRADLVARLRRHPFTRALRPDKASLAGLHATLLHYARGEAEREIPLWRMLAARPEELAARAESWRAALAERGIAAELEAGFSTVGGGSLPGETLPTHLLRLGRRDTNAAAAQPGLHPDELAAALRAAPRPLIGRIVDGALVLDPRTVLPDEDGLLLEALFGVLA
jgi:L-seryl-tRNA(Ser) seleniumtransferase